MIRLSVADDLPAMISLWQEAFGDDEEYIGEFLSAFYSPQNTPVAVIDGKIAAMLFLLDGEMSVGGKKYPAYYLYAACTAKEHRGKGIMTELLDYTAQLSAERGQAFICLKPGEKSLFDFYAKRGYKPAFGRKVFTVHRSGYAYNGDSPLCGGKFEPFKLSEAVFGECDRFVWSESAAEKAVKLCLLGGDRLFKSCKGYALYGVCDAVCTVKEFAITADCIQEFCSYIFADNSCDSIIFSLAPLPDAPSDAAYECNASILALNAEAQRIAENLSEAYIGLTMD